MFMGGDTLGIAFVCYMYAIFSPEHCKGKSCWTAAFNLKGNQGPRNPGSLFRIQTSESIIALSTILKL